jgi:hypothetical protein
MYTFKQVVAEKAAASGLRPDLTPIRQSYGNEFADLVQRGWHADPARVSPYIYIYIYVYVYVYMPMYVCMYTWQ